ncbi:MAG: hypothetical protein AAFQ45_03220 [Pseudomonadota bacterium]
MPILTELVVSIVGGVLTAVILSMFARRPAPAERPERRVRRERRRGGFLSGVFGFLRVLIAVSVGLVAAMAGARWLIQNGIIPRGLPSRLGVLVATTLVVWMLLGMFRRR